MYVNRLTLGATLASVAFAAVTPAAIEARGDVALSRVAAELGYAYAYLGPEDAVSLSRRGVTVLVRPGERLYDVNDRTETMDGVAPHFYQNDLFVSSQFIARLRAIATLYPDGMGGGSGVIPATYRSSTAAVTGPISLLDVRQIPGTQQLDVSGKTPMPNRPITLTLVGTFSSEIPDTVLSRRQVFADSDGRFRANVPIGSGYMRGAYLTLVASSVPGVASASLRFEVKAPNGDISVPSEQPQRSIQ
jgi:hypothetical protein